MNTRDAVSEVLRRNPGLTKYRMAKDLDIASASSINTWLRGTRMSKAVAERFESLYGIKVDDSYDPIRLSIQPR